MTCQLYLISPPAIALADFSEQLKAALDAGGVGAFQLRLKEVADGAILRAAEVLLPICREHEVAFILNDRPDLAKRCGADGVHLGQEDLEKLSGFRFQVSGFSKEQETSAGAQGSPERASCDLQEKVAEANKTISPHGSSAGGAFDSPAPPQGGSIIEQVRALLGSEAVIGVSAHASRHLAMEAAEQGADYVAFGAFYPTLSKPQEKIEKWGVPEPEILTWWSTHTVVPCVAIGGMTPATCKPCVAAGADFIAAITAVWNHPQGAGAAVEAFNQVIRQAQETENERRSASQP